MRLFRPAVLAALLLFAAQIVPAYAAPHPAYATANAQANAVAGLVGSTGEIIIYSGTQPATPETALSGNTALETCTFAATPFGSASNGVITANTMTCGTVAASGTPSFYRVYSTTSPSSSTAGIWDATVGTSGTDLILTTSTLTAGAAFSISGFTYTVPGY